MTRSTKTLLPFLVAAAVLPFRLAVADAAMVGDELPVRTIAVAPVPPVEDFSVENVGGPLDLFAGVGFLIRKSVEKDRASALRNAFAAHSFNVEEEVSQAALSALNGLGLDATEGKGIQHEKDDPSEIDLKNSKTDSDKILSLTISDVGLHSSRLSTKFFPILTIKFELLNRKTEESEYSESIYYGPNADASEKDELPVDHRFAYATFDDAMARQDELIEAYRVGIREISHLAAVHIKNLH
jgi:hypothetical protein